MFQQFAASVCFALHSVWVEHRLRFVRPYKILIETNCKLSTVSVLTETTVVWQSHHLTLYKKMVAVAVASHHESVFVASRQPSIQKSYPVGVGHHLRYPSKNYLTWAFLKTVYLITTSEYLREENSGAMPRALSMVFTQLPIPSLSNHSLSFAWKYKQINQ